MRSFRGAPKGELKQLRTKVTNYFKLIHPQRKQILVNNVIVEGFTRLIASQVLSLNPKFIDQLGFFLVAKVFEVLIHWITNKEVKSIAWVTWKEFG